MRKLVFFAVLGGLLFASGTMAQMRPGAKVEKAILDHANKMSMADLRGTAPLPNPLGGPPNGASFGSPGRAGGE